MKLKSLTIALGTLGIVVLVPMVKVAVAQTAPADALPIWEYDPVAVEMCDRVFAEYAESASGERASFSNFRGLTLTDEQQQAYDALDAQRDERINKVYERSVRADDTTATLSFSYATNVDISDLDTVVSPEVQAAIQAALNKNPTSEQKESLNQYSGHN